MKLLNRKTCLVFTILCFFILFLIPSEPGAAAPLRDNSILPYAPGELLVKFRPDIRQMASDFYQIHMGLASLRSFEHIGVQRFRLPEGLSVEEALGVFKGDPDVEYAEPNYYYQINLIPNDPLFNNLWGLRNTGQTGGTADADIDATEAWDITTGNGNVVVAVIDSGIDFTHGDLSGNIWRNLGEIEGNSFDDDGNGFVDDVRGWDFVLNRNDVSDVLGHGTHVSGTIAAMGNNGTGVSGVSWNAKIMALRFADAGGSGLTTDAISAINYANANGANIINVSWGGNRFSQSLKNAIDASSALVVCAAGNDGLNNDVTPYYPASFTSTNIIAVAATDQYDNLAAFSNYGGMHVDVGAPGVSINSCFLGNTYALLSGTSMAVPHVSGLAALLQGLNPALTPLELKAFIETKVDQKPPLNGLIATGGRVNAQRALEPPEAPSHLSISNTTGTQIDISWSDNSSDESGFKIERKTGDDGTYSEINTTGPDTTQYSDTGLDGGIIYYYRVRAYNGIGHSEYSNENNATTLDTPRAPTHLKVSGSTETSIDLTWTDNAINETGFKIERKVGTIGTYIEISIVAADTTSYSDKGLAGGTAYFYRIRAYNVLGHSGYSNEVNETTLYALQSPTDLAVSSSTQTSIDLTWTDNATNETGFKIERKVGAGGTYIEISIVAADTTIYSDKGLAGGTTYFYRIRAYNGMALSGYSNEISATTSDLSNSFSTASSGGGSGACFVATAAYGSRMESHVRMLCDFRDRYLRDNLIGRAFIEQYYAHSPPLAKFIADNDLLRVFVRYTLLPIVGFSWIALEFGLCPAIISLFLIIFLIRRVKRIRFHCIALSRWLGHFFEKGHDRDDSLAPKFPPNLPRIRACEGKHVLR